METVVDADAIRSIRIELGKRIRTLRKKQGLTQAALGEIVKLDRTYIVGIEKGKRNVSVESLIRISTGLGVRLSELFLNVDADVFEDAK